MFGGLATTVFYQISLHVAPEKNKFSRLGGWNDPDMLIVRWVDWGDKLHETRLRPAEQYTHLTVWAMAAAPLLIGCDLGRLDDFTYNLLSKDEVIAIDQDILGKKADCIFKTVELQIWLRELADGSRALTAFNLSDSKKRSSSIGKNEASANTRPSTTHGGSKIWGN